MAEIVVGENKPDCVLLFDLSLDSFKERLDREGDEGDPFDRGEMKFTKRVIEGYKKMAGSDWGNLNWKIIDGNPPVEKVRKQLEEVIKKIFSI